MLTNPDFRELLNLFRKYGEDLILSKKAAGRPQDQLDIDHLKNDVPLKKGCSPFWVGGHNT